MLHMQGSIMYTTNNKFKSPVFIPNLPVLKGRTVSLKKLFCFSIKVNETWFSCSYLYVPTNTSPIFIESN